MTQSERLAKFVDTRRFEDLTDEAVRQLKIRVLDSLSVALGALAAEPLMSIRALLAELGGNPLATLIGGGASAPDRAAFYNGALVRYLDFNDSFLAKHETCHPSDNLAPVLAAAEYADAGGREFLTALAVAYQVQIRLSQVAPVRARGFDHTTQGAYAVAAGAAKALGLDAPRIANALGMSGAANNALRVTRTGALSQWKGLAYPHVAFSGLHCALLAMRGITGPRAVFEGEKGFQKSIAGPFNVYWEEEGLEGVRRTILKKYDAEIHAQSAIEAALDLKRKYAFSGPEVDRIDVATFQVAYDIIGGGQEGDKKDVLTKEDADHSLPYVLAAAVLDGQVLPAQYDPARIARRDVQDLLQRITIRPDPALSTRFPEEMPVRVIILLRDGRRLERERNDYEGFHRLPLPWERVVEKFHSLAAPHVDGSRRRAVIEAVLALEHLQTRDLTRLLSERSG